MADSWSDYRLEWRCGCGLAWHSPIRNGKFRFSCPDCGKAVLEIEAGADPGNFDLQAEPGAAAAVVRLEDKLDDART